MIKYNIFYRFFFLLCVLLTMSAIYSFHIHDSGYISAPPHSTGNRSIVSSEILDTAEDVVNRDRVVDSSSTNENVDAAQHAGIEYTGAAITVEALSTIRTILSVDDAQPSEGDFWSYFNEFDLSEMESDTDFAKLQGHFDEWLDSSPDAMQMLFDVYDNPIDNDSLSQLQALMKFSNNQNLAIDIVDQIYQTTGRVADIWVDMLEHAGAGSAQSQQSVLSLLPYLDNRRSQEQALLSLRYEAGNSLDESSIHDELALYINHQDTSIRSAAIEALGNWASDSNVHVFETALQQQNQQIRKSAIRTIALHDIRSSVLKSLLLNIMSDNEYRIDTRVDAYLALMNFQTNASEETQLRDFYFSYLHGI